MAEKWLDDVRKYVADADEKVVDAIVKYCGIALRSRDGQLVAMADKKERETVRENYLKKKLGLTQDDATLDAAILSVRDVMKADRTKNRVTVYYLLADHFGSLATFGGAAAAAAVGGAATMAAMMSAPAAAAAPAAPMVDPSGAAPQMAAGGGFDQGDDNDDGISGWGCGVAAMIIGAIIVAALLAWFVTSRMHKPAPAPAPIVAAPAPVAPPAAAEPIPVGAGVTTGQRNEKPMLTVYFATGKSSVTSDFAAKAAEVKDYVAANPAAKLAVSGFNDPTGNAAANAELSKKRAQAVGKALEDIGIPATAIELVKPEATTDTQADMANARRVEVVVQ